MSTLGLITLYILKNLCCDLLLGSDFQSQQWRVVFEYQGSKLDFTVNNKLSTSVTATPLLSPPQHMAKLFTNLLPNC